MNRKLNLLSAISSRPNLKGGQDTTQHSHHLRTFASTENPWNLAMAHPSGSGWYESKDSQSWVSNGLRHRSPWAAIRKCHDDARRVPSDDTWDSVPCWLSESGKHWMGTTKSKSATSKLYDNSKSNIPQLAETLTTWELWTMECMLHEDHVESPSWSCVGSHKLPLSYRGPAYEIRLRKYHQLAQVNIGGLNF